MRRLALFFRDRFKNLAPQKGVGVSKAGALDLRCFRKRRFHFFRGAQKVGASPRETIAGTIHWLCGSGALFANSFRFGPSGQ